MNLGFPEILAILAVVLLLFGPKKLPELGRSLGQGIREFKRGTHELKQELDAGLRDEEPPVASVTTNKSVAKSDS